MPSCPVAFVVRRAVFGAALMAAPQFASAQRALDRVQVTGRDVCNADTAGADPLALATLWNEAREVAARRITFGQGHGFTYTRTSTVEGERLRVTIPRDTTLTVLPTPGDTAAAREPVAQRLGAVRRRWFRTTANIVLPSERVLLSEDFLREHCFAPRVVRGADGTRQLMFVSRYGRRTGLAVEGTLTFGPQAAELQRFDLVYRRADRLLGRSSRTYVPLSVDGQTVMLARESLLQLGEPGDRRRGWFRWQFTEEVRDVRRVP